MYVLALSSRAHNCQAEAWKMGGTNRIWYSTAMID